MARYLDANDFRQTLACEFCMENYKEQQEFTRHLRERHCSVEGGSFVCRYGYNGVCASLPLDGVSDRDYLMHVNKYHVNQKEVQEQKWSVFSAAQNLPAVLNDPSRGKQSNLFTKKWGDSFVEKTPILSSPYLVDIRWEHFDLYLRKIGKRFRRHERLKNMQKADQSPSTPSPRTPTIESLGGATLNDIPGIFFKNDVELHDPSNFALVFPGMGEEERIQSGRLLQEKLSHYLDIVEVHIAKQVSRKSSAFFHAMTTQDAIMEEMNRAAQNVRKLRERLKTVDETSVKDSLKIISLAQVRANKIMVLEKLKLMAHVHKTQPTIQLLLGTQDYVAALDLISTTQDILAQELPSIHCFKHLPSQLNEMDRLIDKMLTTEFERYSTADLNRPLTVLDDRVLEEGKLVCIISGLLRKRNFVFIDSYKEEAITAIRAVIKEMVIELLASTDAEVCLTGAGEEAQILSLSEWVTILETATDRLLKLLRRIRLVHDVMLQTADVSCGRINGEVRFLEHETFLAPEDHKAVTVKLGDLLVSVCNYCHERCANLVSSQSLEKSTATPHEMERLTELVDSFCKGCESVCGVQSTPLRAALTAQGARFAQRFHAERKSKLALLLDSERWKQAEVPAEFQRMIDNMAKGDFLWTKGDDSISVPPSPVLMVEGEPYALVGAGLILVQIIGEYCRCAAQLPIISPQLSRSVVDLLRTFNSRCCQLVLGAGALHVAGLKTITSGNIALVSRALQLVLWLLPHVRAHFQGFDHNGNTAAPTMSYESIEKDFVSHIAELENKILSIVNSLIVSQLGQWDAKPPVPSQSFRAISRHFVKLHEAIAPILPERQIHAIYRTVHRNFKDKLREQLLKLGVTNDGGPQHGTVISELTFYLETLRTLRAIPESELGDDQLDDIWRPADATVK